MLVLIGPITWLWYVSVLRITFRFICTRIQGILIAIYGALQRSLGILLDLAQLFSLLYIAFRYVIHMVSAFEGFQRQVCSSSAVYLVENGSSTQVLANWESSQDLRTLTIRSRTIYFYFSSLSDLSTLWSHLLFSLSRCSTSSLPPWSSDIF